MKFYDPITEDSFTHKMNKICATTENYFTFKDKARELNSALDLYFSWAFNSDGRRNFDDINNTSVPIVSQNVVSGTNAYKFSAFSTEVLNLLKLELLAENGDNVHLEVDTLDDLKKRGDSFDEIYTNASAGTPTKYIKIGDYFYFDAKPNWNKTSGILAFANRPAAKFVFTRFTVTIATPGVFTSAAHGLVANDTVVLNTSGALPTGLSINTLYYVISTGLTADAFQLSATLGGSAIATSSTQSGVHTFIKANKEPGIPVLHHPLLAELACLPFKLENKQINFQERKATEDMFEKTITTHFSRRDKDQSQRLTPKIEDNK